jgi:glutamate N-acetyltransferase/amino-acid N-acetyltransferase
VKTAIAGSDPNWGRILAAAGYSGVEFDPARVDIFLQGARVCRNGLAAPFDEAELKKRSTAAKWRFFSSSAAKAAARRSSGPAT